MLPTREDRRGERVKQDEKHISIQRHTFYKPLQDGT